MKRPQFSLATLLWMFVALSGFIVFTKSVNGNISAATLTSAGFLWQYWISILCVAVGVGGAVSINLRYPRTYFNRRLPWEPMTDKRSAPEYPASNRAAIRSAGPRWDRGDTLSRRGNILTRSRL